ncbi:MAG: hypothetical protein K6F56_06540 [Oscillospiraceae bacterium]|nr:hypothetical protein [Oscillospiraceae bacterium]
MAVFLFAVSCILLLSSGCVFAAARFGLRFEESLPLVMTAVMLFLFLFGMLGLLPFGVYALCAAALLLYALALRRSAGQGRALRARLLTPGALLFLLTFAGLIAVNYGRRVWRIDEMTHWADTVKAMYYTGLLPSAKAAATTYPSYPPGMALMEYLFLRLYALFDRKAGYTEWVMYFAYQCFLLSFSFPFLRALDFRKPLRFALAAALVLLCPLMIDGQRPYSSLYIDPFLSAAFGGGLAAVFTETRKDNLRYDLYVFSACAALVLAKAAGLLLAFFLAAVYAAELLLRGDERRARAGKLAGAACAVFLPLGLWSLRKKLDGVTQSFSSKEGAVDLRMALRCALHREGESWQQIVHDDYYQRLLTDAVRIKGFACPYWLLLLFSIAALWLLIRLTDRRSGGCLRAARRIVLPSLLLISLIYYVSLCYVYIFKFGWWEAVVLASFERYVGIVLYAVYMAAMLGFVRFFTEADGGRASLCAALAVFVVLSPFGRALDVLRRTDMQTVVPVYDEYRALADMLRDETGGSPVRLAILSQTNRAGDSPGIRYLLRPNTAPPYSEWYLGSAPGTEKDGLEDRFLSPEEWMDALRETAEYLYLDYPDGYFYEHYASLFPPDSPPVSKGLYRVDGQLRYVGTPGQG